MSFVGFRNRGHLERFHEVENVRKSSSYPYAVGVVAAGLLICWLLVTAFNAIPDLQVASIALLVSTVVAGALILRSVQGGQWSMAFLVYLATVLFHVGLFLTPAFGGDVPRMWADSSNTWFQDSDMSRAAAFVAIGLLSFALGSSWFGDRKGTAPESETGVEAEHREEFQRSIYAVIGSLMTIAGVSFWFGENISVSGLDFRSQTYEQYLASVANTSITLSFLAIGIGLPLAAQRIKGVLPVAAVLFFFAFAIVGFPLGLRGEVLMPLLVAAAIYVSKRKRPPRWLLSVSALITLVFIAVVKQFRSTGITNIHSFSDLIQAPLSAIQEMGSSVRVVALTISWHHYQGMPFELGGSYYAPMERWVAAIFNMPRPAVNDDFRLFNVLIISQEGTIGGSVIGEAYHNFAVPGIVVIMGLWGALIGWLGRSYKTATRTAVLGIAGIIYVWQVRNASTEIAYWVLTGICCILVARIVELVGQRWRQAGYGGG